MYSLILIDRLGGFLLLLLLLLDVATKMDLFNINLIVSYKKVVNLEEERVMLIEQLHLSCKYSHTPIPIQSNGDPRDPKIVAVVESWSLFSGILSMEIGVR